MATSQTPKITKGITSDMLVSVYKPIGTGENSEVFAGTIADLKEVLGIEPSEAGITSITSTDGSIDIDLTDPSAPDLSIGYLFYTALITQTGTDAPVATVLKNTLGVTLTWSRVSEGAYKVTASSGIFIEAKTWVIINNINIAGTNYFDINRLSNTEVFVASSVFDAGTPPYVPADGIIGALSLEIRVYL